MPAGVPGLRAQSPERRFEHLTVEDGLPENSVVSMVEDRQGFLWLGTRNGLVRYDGYDFVTYQPAPDNPHSLSHGTIHAIDEGADGSIWVGTRYGGLNRLDRTTGRFIHYRHDPDDPSSLGDDRVLAVLEDHSGTLWVGTFAGGLGRLDRATGRFTHYRHDPDDPSSLGDDRVLAVYEDRAGALWVGTFAGGLSRLDRTTGRFTHYRHDPDDPSSLGHDLVQTIYEDRQGGLWVGTGGAGGGDLSRLDRRSGRFTHLLRTSKVANTLGSGQIQVVYEDREGRFWVGLNGGGLNLVDRATGRVSHYEPNGHNPDGFSGNQVWSILQDHAGVLWFGTGTKGLEKWDPAYDRFVHYERHPEVPDGLSDNNIRAVLEDRQGRIWIGTHRGGLNRLDPRTGQFTHFRHDPNDPASLGPGRVVALEEGGDGGLWIGLNDGGLNRLDPATGRVRHYRLAHADSRSGYTVLALLEDGDGLLWVGTATHGLHRLDPRTGRFTPYPPGDPSIPGQGRVLTLYEDRQGTLWAGTYGGLARLDRDTGRFTTYFDPVNGFSQISALWEDRAGRFWVGDRNGGLFRFFRETGSVARYTTRDGLPNDRIHSFLEDNEGFLWIGTGHGLVRFDPVAETFHVYDEDDGLGGSIFNRGAAFRSATGRLYFGGQHGLNAFDPTHVPENQVPPRLALTGISLFNRPLQPSPDGPLTSTPETTTELVLRHDQNYITFEYVGLHYSRPHKIQYAYRLDPLDADWQEAGARRMATFTNLAPGKYTFHVRAANSDGVWNEAGVSIRVVVLPPWWATPGFRIVALLAVAGLIFLGYHYRIRGIKMQNRLLETQVAKRTAEVEAQAVKLEELNRIKSRLFANISHEFRTPLTLTIGPLEDLQHEAAEVLSPRHTRKVDLALRNARRLLRLINQLLDVTRLEAGRMELHPKPGDVVGFLRNLVASFAALAERRQVGLAFQADRDALPARFDHDMLEKVVSNLLSNAFKFTEADGRILVSTTMEAEEVVIAVRDTGTGIPPEQQSHIFDRFYQGDDSSTRLQEGTGIGLSLVKEMVELGGGTVTVESAVGFGSTFTLRLPRGEVDEAMVRAPARPAPERIVRMDLEQGTTGDGASAVADEDQTTVLVVDDNADLRAYIGENLAATYRVVFAADGEDGLEQARRHLPDLIISDVMMPKRDGYGLCRAVRQDPALDCIPVILLTARAEGEDKIAGLTEGADDYLVKPFDMQELLLRVQNQIAARQRLRERLQAEGAAAARTLQPGMPDVVSMEEALLEQVRSAVEAHLGDRAFGVEVLASSLGMSRAHLHRKLRDLTGQTPSALIHTMRLERAGQLLAARAGTVTEVAYAVGFSSLSHFSKTFKDHFGVLPSAYATTGA